MTPTPLTEDDFTAALEAADVVLDKIATSVDEGTGAAIKDALEAAFTSLGEAAGS